MENESCPISLDMKKPSGFYLCAIDYRTNATVLATKPFWLLFENCFKLHIYQPLTYLPIWTEEF